MEEDDQSENCEVKDEGEYFEFDTKQEMENMEMERIERREGERINEMAFEKREMK